MKSQNLTEADIDGAAQRLARSERGRNALRDVIALLNNGGIGLDSENQQAVMTLLYAAFTDWPGYSRDAMRNVIVARERLADINALDEAPSAENW